MATRNLMLTIRRFSAQAYTGMFTVKSYLYNTIMPQVKPGKQNWPIQLKQQYSGLASKANGLLSQASIAEQQGDIATSQGDQAYQAQQWDAAVEGYSGGVISYDGSAALYLQCEAAFQAAIDFYNAN